MISTTFNEVLIGVSVTIGFIAVAIGLLAGLWWVAYVAGGWDYYDQNKLRAWVAAICVTLIGIPIAAAYILVLANVLDEDSDTFYIKGGLGPETVCWYELVDDDTVVSTGKTAIIIDGEEKRTVCNKTPDAIPEEVKQGLG